VFVVRLLQWLQQLSWLHIYGDKRLQRNGLLVRIVRILRGFVQLLPRLHDQHDRQLHQRDVYVYVLRPQ
jgi:hypothetical protein